MNYVSACRNTMFVIFIVFIQIQSCLLQTNWKSQKRSAEPNASESPKAKLPSILSHQLQRRLLPKTDMQQKVQNTNQNKKLSKIDVEEVDGNDVNRVSDDHVEELINEEPKQGECTNCADETSALYNKWTTPLVKSGDKRYYIGTFFKANWYRAAQFCRYHGMQLASINNQEENDGLEKYLTNFGYGFEHFWTSGTDLAEEGSFFWMSTGKPFSFTNWNAGEPNNFRYENGEEEHCLELWNRDGKGLKWNDSPCSFETYFICEM